MSELKAKGKSRFLDHPADDESECPTCEYYDTCKKDPNFDESNGKCGDYILKANKTSAVVE